MLSCQRHLFDLPEDIHYLNGAYMSPQLRRVEEVGLEMLPKKSRPYLTTLPDFFEPVKQVKNAFAQLANIAEPDRVALIPAASYGLANVAKNVKLKPGQKIIVVGEQFPSNYYVWKRLADEYDGEVIIISAPESATRGQDWNQEILRAIDEQTAVVALSHVHWADGTKFALEAIRVASRNVGALLIIDGTQSLGALPFDVARIQPDALIVAGYKWLLGPYSQGVAYYGSYFDDGVPVEENWINRQGSDDFRLLVNYQDNYQAFAGRYSVGEQSNFVYVPMLLEALQQLLRWGVSDIQQYCAQLSQPFLVELQDMGIQVETPEFRAAHLFGLRFSNASIDIDQLKKELQKRQVFVSFRGNSMRVSPNVYNRQVDFQKLIGAFRTAKVSKSIIATSL